MSILTVCPSCNQHLQVPEELLGRLVQCPRCDSQFTASAGSGAGAGRPPPLPEANEIPTQRRFEESHPPREEIQEKRPRRRGEDDWIEEDRPRRRAPAGDDWDDDKDRGRRSRRRDVDRDEDEDYGLPYRRGPGLRGLSNQYAIDIGVWFNYAKDHYSAAFGPMIGFLLIHVLIGMVESIPFLGILIALAMLFLNPALQAGFAIVALAQLRGRRWNFGDFFAGFNWYGALLGNFWLTVAITLACAVPGLILVIIAGVIAELTNTPELWVLAVVAGVASFGLLIYITVRTTCFSVQLIVDRGCGPLEAIQGSWNLSRGHFWGLFGVSLLLAMIVLAGLVAFLVGALFAVPFVILTQNAGYLLITDRQTLQGGRVHVDERRGYDDDERRERWLWVIDCGRVVRFGPVRPGHSLKDRHRRRH